ncbi:MAG: phosphoglucosamine mutase [Candidatus Kapabacteria bacterium]|nr:phosphoglucosamine mutase [Candidatus Kapabacteria bacterium]
MPLIRSISGLRATLGDALTPAVVADYTAAFAAMLPDGPIVVGRDGRPSGSWINDIVIGALRASGRHVSVLDMVPTPTVQLLTEHSDAVGGISITASHNPAPWNGLKFIGGDGVFLDATANAELWARVDGKRFALSDQQQSGSVENVVDAIDRHINAIMALPAVATAPSAGGQTVVVDAVNCSGSVIVPALLRRMGYTVVELYCNGNGKFPHVPEPLAENLVDLGNAVRAHDAVMGVAVDPDADRLVLFDEHGEPIGEERTIALAAEAVLRSDAAGSVIVNYSTSRMVDDVAAKYGCLTHRAAVGEINVVRRMQAEHAVIGGEGSGGVILPACHYGRDAMVGIGLITSMLRSTQRTMSQAVADMPSYSMLKTKITVDNADQAALLLERVAARFDDGVVSREDGIHVSYSDRWLHVRTSNTEPILRIIVEAPDAAAAATMLADIQQQRTL